MIDLILDNYEYILTFLGGVTAQLCFKFVLNINSIKVKIKGNNVSNIRVGNVTSQKNVHIGNNRGVIVQTNKGEGREI